MHIHAFLWIAIIWCTSVHGIIQYKVRGHSGGLRAQSHHSHPYPATHYTKAKWPMPPPVRSPQRPNMRPLPVHMASYKMPVVVRPPNKTPAPLIFPSAVWKTPTAVYRPPLEHKPYLVASPSVTHASSSYEFLLNQDVPLNVPTIKQVGEKGPIHTIPAPNLSPADKPHVILEEPTQKHTYHYYNTKETEFSPNAISPSTLATNTLLGAQALPLVSTQHHHQYQVTENVESNDQVNHMSAQKPSYYAADHTTQNAAVTKPYLEKNVHIYEPSTDLFLTPQQSQPGIQLSAQDLYQLLNGIPQQQLADSYGLPLIQQPQLQQHFVQQAHHHHQQTAQTDPSYQALLRTGTQYAQPEPPSSYYNQIDGTETVISQRIKDNFKPQFHTFNYEEPVKKHHAQSRVTADYGLDVSAEQETVADVAVQHPNDALAQTRYIQQYFATGQDNNQVATEALLTKNENNEAESTDAADGSSQMLSQLTAAKNEISPSMFYSSLPNREVAETLATLQAAGSSNNHFLKRKQSEEMRIYVPDRNDEEEQNYEDMETQASGDEKTKNNTQDVAQGIRIYETTYAIQNADDPKYKYESAEYEDYSSELDADINSKTQAPFGNKLKSKTPNAT